MTEHGAYAGVRASRPLGNTGWINTVESAAAEVWGEGVFDFKAKEIAAERDLVLLGSGEQASMQIRTESLEGIEPYEVIRSAKRNMPQSFSKAAQPRLSGKLTLPRMTEDSGVEFILTAHVSNEKHLVAERFGALRAIERHVQQGLPWHATKLRIKLGILAIVRPIENEELDEVAKSLPPRIAVKEGHLVPITFQPRNSLY